MRTIGTEAALRAATSATLKSYHEAWYKPDKLVVTVAGHIDEAMRSEIHQKVTSWYQGLSGESSDFVPVAVSQKEPRLMVETKPDSHQAHIELGIRSFARASADRYAWNLFNLQFGVGFTSRLFREIREKKGLCYTVRSGASSWADSGYWSIYAGVSNDKIEEATSAILDEMKKVREKGFTEEELGIAKKRLKTVLAFKSEDPEFLGEYYGRQEVFGQPIQTLEEYLKHIEHVTVEEVNALIRKYFITQTLNMAVVTNRKDKGWAKLLSLS
jgi:predicted Zn-dependent peptidase